MDDSVVKALARLRARREEIEDAVFAQVSYVVPDEVGSTDTEYVEGLRAAVRASVEYMLEGIEHTGELAEPIPMAVVEQARRAARAGVGLDTVLRRCVAGYWLLGDYVMRVTERDGLSGQGAALRETFQTAAALVDRLIAAVAGAYGEEAERAGSRGRGVRPCVL
jgi:hypothetical protein